MINLVWTLCAGAGRGLMMMMMMIMTMTEQQRMRQLSRRRPNFRAAGAIVNFAEQKGAGRQQHQNSSGWASDTRRPNRFGLCAEELVGT